VGGGRDEAPRVTAFGLMASWLDRRRQARIFDGARTISRSRGRMTSGSWPYLPEQCPGCFYFEPASPPFVDDSGYEILGFCCHPRIGMELFQPQKLDLSKADRCPLFVRRPPRRADSD
jgi:hypothetical protein